jgi:cytosine permease
MPLSHPAADTDRVGGIELESEFEQTAVPASHRKPLREVAAVWFGFPMILTNAVPGGVVVALLGFWRGVAAITVANIVMLVYVGLLSHRAGSTGRSFALQATQTFGRVGYILASGFLATIVVGWFAFNTGATGATINASFGWDKTLVILGAGALFIAVTFVGIRALSILGAIAAPLFIVVAVIALVIVAGDHDLGAVFSYGGVGGAAAGSLSFGAAVSLIMATFADSGTMTADFTRWSRNGREGVLAAATAFPVASMVAQLTGGVVVAAGAIAAPATDGGNFLPLLADGAGPLLSALAIVFVFVNLGSVCSHCLYNGAVSWSSIVGGRMRILTLLLGIAGVGVALAGVWSHFLSWLVILSVFVPPIGAVLIADQVLLRGASESRLVGAVRPTAFAAWAVGAGFAALVHYEAPQWSDAVVGLVTGAVAYLAIEAVAAQSRVTVARRVPDAVGAE